MDTTPYKNTNKIKTILKTLDKFFERPSKPPAFVELTSKQYQDYMSAISDNVKKDLIGNPMYKGIEIKKMSDK